LQEALLSALFADLDGEALDLLVEGGGVGPAAFLGDDLSDKVALRGVWRECRVTAAELWLRPPWELSGFLERWIKAETRPPVSIRSAAG
jgi:hypothetical protein